jgi:branched-subunit amino acid transport protein
MTLGAVLALAVGTYALRLAGPLMRGRLRISARGERMMSIAAVTLLGAFVASSALLESGGFAGWARVAGVAAGAGMALRRAPFVLVVLVAAGTTAGLRFLV